MGLHGGAGTYTIKPVGLAAYLPPRTPFDTTQRYVVSRTGIRWLWYLGEPGFESRALNLSHTYLVNMCIIATRKPVQIYLSNAKSSVWDIRVLLAISAEG